MRNWLLELFVADSDWTETDVVARQIPPDGAVASISSVSLTLSLSSAPTAGVPMELPVCLPGVPSHHAALRAAFPAGESSLPADREEGWGRSWERYRQRHSSVSCEGCVQTVLVLHWSRTEVPSCFFQWDFLVSSLERRLCVCEPHSQKENQSQKTLTIERDDVFPDFSRLFWSSSTWKTTNNSEKMQHFEENFDKLTHFYLAGSSFALKYLENALKTKNLSWAKACWSLLEFRADGNEGSHKLMEQSTAGFQRWIAAFGLIKK